jgi:hypothetical protein
LVPLLLRLEDQTDLPHFLKLRRRPAELPFALLLKILSYLFLEAFQLPDQLGCLPFVGGQEMGLHVPGLFMDLLQFPEEVLRLPSVEPEGGLAEVDGLDGLDLLRAEVAKPSFLLHFLHLHFHLLDQPLGDGGQLIVESPMLLGQTAEEFGEGRNLDAFAEVMGLGASFAGRIGAVAG